MRMTYDPEVDALAIDLVPDARSARMVNVDEFTRLDYDAKGRLVSIEVLDASRGYGREALAAFAAPTDWLNLAAAAAESGLEHGTLRQLVHAGKFPSARKSGRDWEITRTELFNYLEQRSPRGRPAKRQKARRRAAPIPR